VWHQLVVFFGIQKVFFSPPPNPRVHTLAVQHRQHKKRHQLIPEFAAVHWVPANTPITTSQKIILSSLPGGYQEGDPNERSNDDILVGTWHTPDQFVKKAQGVTHPMDERLWKKLRRMR